MSSRTQAIVALSIVEAEFVAGAGASAEVLLLAEVFCFFGAPLLLTLAVDSSAARAVFQRKAS